MGALHDAVHAAVDEQFRSESSPKRQRKPRVGWRKWEQVVVYEVRSLNDFRCFVGIVIKSNMARVAMAAIERLMKDGEQLSDYALRLHLLPHPLLADYSYRTFQTRTEWWAPGFLVMGGILAGIIVLSSFRFCGRRRACGRPAPDAVDLDCRLRRVVAFAMNFPQFK